MTKNSRIVGFGGSGVLVIAGIVCAVAVGGTLGTVLAFTLISLGLVLATSLVFLEVGLSEDRERERDAARNMEAGRARMAEREREVQRKHEAAHEESREGERDRERTSDSPRGRPYLPRSRGERRHIR